MNITTRLLISIFIQITLFIGLSFVMPSSVFSAENETKQLLLEIKGELKAITAEIRATNQRIDELDKRLTAEIRATNQRIDELDKRLTAEIRATNQRIDDVNHRIQDIYTAMGYLTGAVTAVLIASIGFAYWDRRTAIRQAKNEAIAEIEASGRLRDVIGALRELAKIDSKVAGVLRSFNLL